MTHELKGQIGNLLRASSIPGLGVALVQNSAVSWTASFGVKNTVTGEPISSDTVFSAASLGKPISAFLALSLWAQSKLDIDSGIGRYLGIDDPEIGSITPRQILGHTSGLPNWFPELVERLKGGSVLPKGSILSARPGERYLYSGEGYFWLQRVLERITGLPFNSIAEQELFERLGMERTSFVWKSDFEGTAASGHDEHDQPLDWTERVRIHSYANSAASLYTTPQDLGVFVASLMAPRSEDQRIVDEMLLSQIELNEHISWALGWGVEIQSEGDRPWYWHHGRGEFTNLILWSPDREIGLVVLTNTKRNEAAESLEREIVSLAIGGEHPAFDFMPRRVMQGFGFLD